jgi:hypothetical protein
MIGKLKRPGWLRKLVRLEGMWSVVVSGGKPCDSRRRKVRDAVKEQCAENRYRVGVEVPVCVAGDDAVKLVR